MEIGDEFVLQEVGPTSYKRGIADAQAYLRDRVADLDGVCSEPECGYWNQESKRERIGE